MRNEPCDTPVAGIILCMHPANGRRRYNVTSSLIGWAHTQNDPCCGIIKMLYRQYIDMEIPMAVERLSKMILMALVQDCSNSIANALEVPQSCSQAIGRSVIIEIPVLMTTSFICCHWVKRLFCITLIRLLRANQVDILATDALASFFYQGISSHGILHTVKPLI